MKTWTSKRILQCHPTSCIFDRNISPRQPAPEQTLSTLSWACTRSSGAVCWRGSQQRDVNCEQTKHMIESATIIFIFIRIPTTLRLPTRPGQRLLPSLSWRMAGKKKKWIRTPYVYKVLVFCTKGLCYRVTLLKAERRRVEKRFTGAGRRLRFLQSSWLKH